MVLIAKEPGESEFSHGKGLSPSLNQRGSLNQKRTPYEIARAERAMEPDDAAATPDYSKYEREA